MRGSVVKKGARWYVVVEDRDAETGRRKRRWHSGYRTKRDAQVACSELLAALHRGDYVAPNRQTVEEFAVEWLDAIRATTLLLMAGIRATHRGPGHAVRALARTISPALARTGLSRLVRHQVAHWRAVGMTGPEWPIITAQLEETVLAMHQSNLRRRS